MGRTATYVVIAEDLAGARFVEAYLAKQGVDVRAIRTRISQGGSGKQWVTSEYPCEVTAYRSKRNHVYKALLVATDADELRLQERHAQLAKALSEASLEPRGRDEEIVLAISKWEIETWAKHLLEGVPVSEDEKTGWRSDRSERDCPRAGRLLAEHRAPKPACCPPSMIASDEEFARLS